MPNRQYAKEWMVKAYHDLSSARILFDADHFTDSIASDLQQSIEKCLKSFLAYENERIKKTHNLIELSELVSDWIQFDDAEARILGIATLYYLHERYPVSQSLPSREQVKEVLEFTERLFVNVCRILEIDQGDVKA